MIKQLACSDCCNNAGQFRCDPYLSKKVVIYSDWRIDLFNIYAPFSFLTILCAEIVVSNFTVPLLNVMTFEQSFLRQTYTSRTQEGKDDRKGSSSLTPTLTLKSLVLKINTKKKSLN